MPDSDVLDDALERLGRYGPEFGGGLSNHGPMAVEALTRLGRGADVHRWLDQYCGRLEVCQATPTGGTPVLADMSTYADWELHFARELAEAPWLDVVRATLPRFAPGVMAAATHGWLRTAHAVRSLRQRETSERLAELARGLAYWAARYQQVPGPPIPVGTLQLSDAIAALPARGLEEPGLIFDAIREALGHHEILVVPEDDAIRHADEQGLAPLDGPRDTPGILALLGLGERLAVRAAA